MNSKTSQSRRPSPITRPLEQLALGLLLLLLALPAHGEEKRQEIVVYSARNEHLIKPLFDAYQAKHKVDIRYITDRAPALLERLRAEGRRTGADILLTVDAGNLWQAAERDLLQPISSKLLEEKIPEQLRDPKKRWYGLSIRARTMAYNPERIKPDELSNYEDLGAEKWRGRLCLRTAQSVYNQSLVAMMIHEHGAEKTEKLIESWVKNLATRVFANDTAVLNAIDAGQCDVGIVNSYYYAQRLTEKPDLKVQLHWPSKEQGGVHVNISGAGVSKYSRNKEAAVQLLEWMVGDEAQEIIAGLNFEFPIRRDIEAAPIVKSWGIIEQQQGHLSKAGDLQADAIRLMDRAGYR